ncbi:hypothetical protein GLOTRDRAFT_133771 [Gloeophyllum trabeum ATCC 11539]|uniref:Uncharacterized protein n=1 Tax=Gloeophyllum trabeum (strain ATCC 11539 / FP-39264 / Madison 617) TaxID=670483 RepID=S7PS77_GLOTA|nr:uncharacterized protein GLOTRDRAFT_133771 [Gloeophyllum trabeum ATCC 11539]EPQ50661.1 hypothetical protein GLOTRDRAFT_133771 [Gloeophyllum trabeum ATCC 11539]
MAFKGALEEGVAYCVAGEYKRILYHDRKQRFPPPSSIPFPSAPIPVPTRTPDHEYPPKRTPFAPYTLDDLENAASNDQLYGNVNEKSVSFDSSPWHVQLHRRRSQSCLVQTFFHDENNQPDPPRRPWRTRKDAARTRATSHSARAPMFIPTPEPQPVVIVKSPKERKASKKAQADMRFLAAVYRSLKWFIDYRELEDALAEDSESTAQGGEMTEQDRIFLCRLYENLVHQGCQPILLNVSCPSNPTPLCSPDSSRSSVSPQAVDIPASPVLSEAPLSAPPEVLTPPQVVASLILRHRDRSTVRPRSSSPTTRATKGSSPLRECVLLATV